MIRGILFALCLFLVNFAFAESTPSADRLLRWGVDLESGAPYSFKDPKNPKLVIGYEAEMVEAIAKKMGRQVVIVQNNWEGLVEGLKRKDYDIVVNGLEITDERKREVHFSDPYYYCTEVITVSKTNNNINSFADLENKRVGTLTGTLAQRILVDSKKSYQIVPYAEEVHLYEDLSLGRLDAVFLDEPIALYYGKPNPRLKIVGEPVGEMIYGIASRKEDHQLNQEIQIALKSIIEDGTMRTILERWGLWNQKTANAWGMSTDAKTPASSYEEFLNTAWAERGLWEKIKNYLTFLPILGKGALMTLQISIVSMLLAILIGLLVALMRLYGPWPISWIATTYVEVFRGTPLLIQLYLIFYGLPHLGLSLPPFLAAVIGLGLNYGACESENYRGGINSIPKSQTDAALALGLNRWQTLRYVTLPQAMRLVLPPVTNDFIALLKDSSLVSIITMVELTTIYGQLASTYFDYLGLGLLTALFYFLIGLPFVRLSRWLEKK